MNLYEARLEFNNTPIVINLDNVVAISPNISSGQTVIDCIGEEVDRSYYLNESFETTIKRLNRGEWNLNEVEQ